MAASLGKSSDKAFDRAECFDFAQENRDPVEDFIHVVGFEKIHGKLVVPVCDDRNIATIDRGDGLVDLLTFFFGRWLMPGLSEWFHRGLGPLAAPLSIKRYSAGKCFQFISNHFAFLKF